MTEETFTLTHATSHTATQWDDQRTYNFPELADLLSKPVVGPKVGPCYTPATFRVPQRKLDHAERIDVAVLDSDCGHNLDEITSAIKRLDCPAIIHSTHSHLKCKTQIARSPYEKWVKDNLEKTVEHYLLERGGYLPRVLEDAHFIDEPKAATGNNLLVEHKPCPKYRIVIPLSRPWRASDFTSQSNANAHWAKCIGNLADALNVRHDKSCEDTSRLFYLPRIAIAGSAFEYAVLP